MAVVGAFLLSLVEVVEDFAAIAASEAAEEAEVVEEVAGDFQEEEVGEETGRKILLKLTRR